MCSRPLASSAMASPGRTSHDVACRVVALLAKLFSVSISLPLLWIVRAKLRSAMPRPWTESFQAGQGHELGQVVVFDVIVDVVHDHRALIDEPQRHQKTAITARKRLASSAIRCWGSSACVSLQRSCGMSLNSVGAGPVFRGCGVQPVARHDRGQRGCRADPDRPCLDPVVEPLVGRRSPGWASPAPGPPRPCPGWWCQTVLAALPAPAQGLITVWIRQHEGIDHQTGLLLAHAHHHHVLPAWLLAFSSKIPRSRMKGAPAGQAAVVLRPAVRQAHAFGDHAQQHMMPLFTVIRKPSMIASVSGSRMQEARPLAYVLWISMEPRRLSMLA